MGAPTASDTPRRLARTTPFISQRVRRQNQLAQRLFLVYTSDMAAMAMTGEHAVDVLEQLNAWLRQGEPGALVLITATEGGAVRAPGALLAVCSAGHVGYISGGCIDADVILQARQAIADRAVRSLRYGAGSPFVDLPLPCGGAIEVLIIPHPDAEPIQQAYQSLSERQNVQLNISQGGALSVGPTRHQDSALWHTFKYVPKLRLRIAGRGADALALAKISDAAGYETHLQLLDPDDLREAHAVGLRLIEQLDTPSKLSEITDDPWTAFVLMFHDRNWETPLLQQALRGPAFYIGAVGSAKTHARRCDTLRQAGTSAADIDRIFGPIGLVRSMRDASMLAISTLAEIVERYHARERPAHAKTALILLAAGQSSRYEHGDKLLANLFERPVLAHAAALKTAIRPRRALAIVPKSDPDRAALAQRYGWEIVENSVAAHGQARSIQLGLSAIQADPNIDQVLVLLGDMPFVPSQHLNRLMALAQDAGVSAIMSESEGILSPPALFKRACFAALHALDGDNGAKRAFQAMTQETRTLALSPSEAQDIDRVADLRRAKETEHA
ncbi:MAG: NTP transferase domain-containing protein [Pseudomonadota bacterium]